MRWLEWIDVHNFIYLILAKQIDNRITLRSKISLINWNSTHKSMKWIIQLVEYNWHTFRRTIYLVMQQILPTEF